MTPQSHLSTVSSNLVLSASEKTSIETSIATLKIRLHSYFGLSIKEKFKFGSSNRGTILPRRTDSKSDVDFMVVFDDDTTAKPQTLLRRLRKFVETKYSTSEVKQSSPTIILSLNHIHFELVPAIRKPSSLLSIGGTLHIPSPSSYYYDWMATYPYAADKAITDHNVANKNFSKPLVRLLKYWNTQADPNSRPFSSFELERYVTSVTFYGNWNIKDHFYDVVSWLPVAWEKSETKKNRISRFKETVAKAQQMEQAGRPYSALAEIKKVIPDFS
jgi:hypothetical protein